MQNEDVVHIYFWACMQTSEKARTGKFNGDIVSKSDNTMNDNRN